MADDKGKNVADATAGAEDEDGEEEIRLRPRKAPVAPLVLKPAELLKSASEALDALRAKRPLVAWSENWCQWTPMICGCRRADST